MRLGNLDPRSGGDGHIGFRAPGSKDVLGFLVTLFLAVCFLYSGKNFPAVSY